MSEDLASFDAVETARRIRSKELSAREVVEAAIRRAEKAEALGAIVAPAFERALERADTVRGGAFRGVPMFIKDLAEVEGLPTGWGSGAASPYVSKRSTPIVGRFEELGLVNLGKSATPEFGLMATTEPLGRAPCRNPWDPTRSTGGSSGGAAALVSSGVVPIAHASDGGGSIRIPAACTGLVGLKPSRFRLDMDGSPLLPVNIATDGVVTRTVRDTVAFYSALELSRSPRRISSVGRVETPPPKLRIGLFVESPIASPVSPEVRQAVESAGRTCETLGHTVDLIPCPVEAEVVDDFLRYWGFMAWIQHKTFKVMQHRGFDAAKLEPWSKSMSRTFTEAPRECAKSVLRLRKFPSVYAGLMRRFDVLLCPTLAMPAVPLGHLRTDLPYELLRERLRAYCPFTPIQNASGGPAISLPLGRTSSGLPIGVQFAGGFGKESTLLSLALTLEEATPWPKVAPRERWHD